MSSVTVTNFERKPSTQMRAVLMVLEADPYLRQAIAPFIDLNLETIYWDQISKMSLCSGQRTVVGWLYGIWTDEPRPRSNVLMVRSI